MARKRILRIGLILLLAVALGLPLEDLGLKQNEKSSEELLRARNLIAAA